MTKEQAQQYADLHKPDYVGKTLKIIISGKEHEIKDLIHKELESQTEDEENKYQVFCLIENGELWDFDDIKYKVEITKVYKLS